MILNYREIKDIQKKRDLHPRRCRGDTTVAGPAGEDRLFAGEEEDGDD